MPRESAHPAKADVAFVSIVYNNTFNDSNYLNYKRFSILRIALTRPQILHTQGAPYPDNC